jgi:hypothetical protein
LVRTKISRDKENDRHRSADSGRYPMSSGRKEERRDEKKDNEKKRNMHRRGSR